MPPPASTSGGSSSSKRPDIERLPSEAKTIRASSRTGKSRNAHAHPIDDSQNASSSPPSSAPHHDEVDASAIDSVSISAGSVGSRPRSRTNANANIGASAASAVNGTSAAGAAHASFSSSLNQKTPARSYFHRSMRGSIGGQGKHRPPRSSFVGVRDRTEELASFALADNSDSPLRERRTSKVEPSIISADVIEERSEPNSFSHSHSHSKDDRETEDIHPAMNWRDEPVFPKAVHDEHDDEEEHEPYSDDEDQDDENDFLAVTVKSGIISQPHETTPLLRQHISSQHGHYRHRQSRDEESLKVTPLSRVQRVKKKFSKISSETGKVARLLANPKAWDRKAIYQKGIVQPASFIPAVFLGLLLNVLDALSYGMILFPLGNPIFEGLGPDGISMFYVSCIVSQLVYSLGGSMFRGGIGSEMIEVVPFFHKMAFTIIEHVGEDKRDEVLATTITAYALSSIITGAVFYLMGQQKLGALIGFFPRHILIGCIGGVGFFLVVTGIEVSARLEDSLEYNFETLKILFQADTIAHWAIPLGLSVILILIKRWVHHSLTDAAYFVSILALFHFFTAVIPSLSFEQLRSQDWIFQPPEAGTPWWHFWTLYNFKLVNWEALLQAVPAMFALTFFGVLHVPINIPALGVTTGEDNVDVDRELRAHGLSNAISGLCGSIQNYLVYTNTVLFMRSGGDSRVAGVFLALATVGILVIGPVLIGFIPVLVVGALIFYLGFDLLKEALILTIGRVNRVEYLTILVIVIVMGVYDFVVGILVGIVLACVSYVLQTSQVSAIRGSISGDIAASTVRRHPMQRQFLQQVGKQIYVIKLAGYLFFGTIVGVENKVRELLSDASFESTPIRFLILDLSKVDGIDFSAAEAFTRVNRLLIGRNVKLILCGFKTDAPIGQALWNVGLLNDQDEGDGVSYFQVLNSALEYCENDFLRAFYEQRDALAKEETSTRTSKYLDIPKSEVSPALSDAAKLFDETVYSSPRRGHIVRAATMTLQSTQYQPEISLPPPALDTNTQTVDTNTQPLQLMMQVFHPLLPHPSSFWARAAPYFSRQTYAAHSVLYRAGDPSDTGWFLLESGVLKAAYRLPQGHFSEVIVAGATCGELPFFGGTERTSTTTAERDCVVWVLTKDRWEDLLAAEPEVASEMLKIGLKLTSERMDAITKHMLLGIS